MAGREGQEADIAIDQRVITESSQSTIQRLLDALVELVTNSDDSYRRLESRGISPDGRISVYVHRHRAGVVSEVVVTDWAEGMTLDRIAEVLVFAADTSGFNSGGNIRGIFGKGLKEAIFALGSGRIESVCNGALSVVTVWQDQDRHRYRWRIDKDGQASTESNYTRISVSVTNPKINSPKWEGLTNQLCTHFVLREICSDARYVEMILQDTSIKNTARKLYQCPQALSALRKDINVEGLGTVHLSIDESAIALNYARNDPCSVAGIVVKTEGIPFDNRAFGFENDEAARYFSGTVEAPAIAQVLRSGDLTILSPSRTGLDWRNSLAAKLHSAVESELRPLVERKRRYLESERRTATRENYRRRLRDVCDLLNLLSEDEIEEMPQFGREQAQLEGLAIRPDVGYERPGEQRRFSIYLPSAMAGSNTHPRVAISLEDIEGEVRASATSVTLAPQHSNPEILTSNFSMMGVQEGASCTIYAQWREEEDIAEFRVREPSTRTPTVDPPRTRGLFREIYFDDHETSPIQRVSYNNGNITIYLHFPVVRNYLGSGGDGMDTPLGSLMCAELVAEAFGREVARRRLESGAIVPIPGSEIDTYNAELNTLSRKYIHAVHQALQVPSSFQHLHDQPSLF